MDVGAPQHGGGAATGEELYPPLMWPPAGIVMIFLGALVLLGNVVVISAILRKRVRCVALRVACCLWGGAALRSLPCISFFLHILISERLSGIVVRSRLHVLITR